MFLCGQDYFKRAALSKNNPPVPLMSNPFRRDQPHRDLYLIGLSFVRCRVTVGRKTFGVVNLRRIVKLSPCDYRVGANLMMAKSV